MEDIIRRLGYKIADNGFMSATSIRRVLKEMEVDEESIPKIFEELDNAIGVHKIKYTNRFIEKYSSRDLYVYNPNKRKRKPKNKGKQNK